MKTYTLYDYFSQDGFYLTQGYGTNKYHDYTQYGLLFHEGIDLSNQDKKAIIRCPFPQAIVIQDWDITKDNYGDHVVLWDWIQLCGLWVNHLDWNKVNIGDKLKAGDIIGEMGATGNTQGEHVHANFVITDEQGNRLYKSKSQNLGFLDPQYPTDPMLPVQLPGVSVYEVNWIAPSINNMPSEPNQVCYSPEKGNELVGNSVKWEDTHKYLELGGSPKDTPFKDAQYVIAGIKSRVTALEKERDDAKNEQAKFQTEAENQKDKAANTEAKCQRDIELKNAEIAELKQGAKGHDSAKATYLATIEQLESQLRAKQKEVGLLNIQLSELRTQLEQSKDNKPISQSKFNLLNFLKSILKIKQ